METKTLGERIAACKREIRSRSIQGVERRTFPTHVEARATAAGWQIVGHGIVYNVLSDNLGGFREQVAVGAADGVLAKRPDIRGLFNHNPDLILGRTIAGTMTVEDDAPVGVRYVIDPPPGVDYADNLRVSLERGDVTQSSFAFRVASGGDVWDEDPESGLLIRTIIKFSELFDMSPVTYAAYPSTDVGAASNNFERDERDVAPDLGSEEPAPADERVDDGAASPRVDDGDSEERQADESQEDEQGAWRLALRQRRMSALEAMGDAPTAG